MAYCSWPRPCRANRWWTLCTFSASIFGAFAAQIGQTIGPNANLTYNSTTGVLAYDADGAGSTLPIAFAIMGAPAHPAAMGSDFLIVA